MEKTIKNKRGLALATSQSCGYKNKFRKMPLSVACLIKFDTIERVFELFQKLHLQIYANQFMTSSIIPLPFVLLSMESVERKEKNYKNLNISRMKRAS